MIDLRSDTVTRPTPGMLAAMIAAAVGDDVFGEDPTVNELERRTAELFGMEAGLFVPTGTMANQIAVRVHCRPQDEILLESTSHIYLWEAGGPAALSGVTCRTIDSRKRDGLLGDGDFEGKVRPNDMHAVRTRLVCLENTHNRGGGTVYSLDAVSAISALGAAQQARDAPRRRAHLERDRERPASRRRSGPTMFDTVAVCFSKGLGAPVGSMLLGPSDLITHGPPHPQAVRRGDAAGGLPRGRVPVRAGPPRRAARGGPRERADHRQGGRGRAGLHADAAGGGNESGVVRGGRAARHREARWPSG